MRMTWKRTMAAALAAVALAGCGGGRDYPPAIRNQFIQSCIGGGGTRGQCECALDVLEDRFTLEEFTAESTRFAQGGGSPEFQQAVQEAIGECR